MLLIFDLKKTSIGMHTIIKKWPPWLLFGLCLSIFSLQCSGTLGYQERDPAHFQNQPTPVSSAKSIKRILVAPLYFPDHKADLEIIKKRYVDFLSQYIKEVSQSQVELAVTVTPWVPMPHPVAEYRLKSFHIREMQKDWTPQYRLVKDATDLLDPIFDFSEFDGLMLAVGVEAKDLGRTGYLFRSSWQFNQLRTPRGQRIPPTDVHTWNCPFPSIAYALPKMIAGYRDGRAVVPTLYDIDAQSTPGPFIYANQHVGGMAGVQYISIHLGPWDIQSQHGIKTEQGVLPLGLSSFTRIRLGWIGEEKILTIRKGEAKKVLLSPLLNIQGKIRVVRLPIDKNRYYLIENRQQEGIDRYLPSEGTLILKIDETIPEGKGPVRVINAHPEAEYFTKAPFRHGETFEDLENGIKVKIIKKEKNNYWLEINRDG